MERRKYRTIRIIFKERDGTYVDETRLYKLDVEGKKHTLIKVIAHHARFVVCACKSEKHKHDARVYDSLTIEPIDLKRVG